ncbi:MFS transporter, UMF1 family [Candidatus Kryptonium thompsonii]|uniref:MFS transporter, UMF1 family n=2 Tax=Candidatus Kryptonium thompsonii TaxID=1633631 RepID=A0A0P1MSE7_9BACT|nr:MFS transporter [Candidatus Kryptonium thompsoni]CUS78427.1 MFS transporter, UMF1 family [Candidatus Kryptonium thompsoni]CUS83996.1 MFS transporter, UMF1 family [Candidatus Kryptonium thompsoni]CUS90948.1 MFS transporter, UMF1 family [Candidatus Kryptonium thompsoni]CUS91015.1 MFS transporter, UMF1 family [Candidatus Kryptonium thompsoni]CUS91373.1 MFS transporter, UMF1 family [Candidatus Kryptonium thompsoni]
MGNRFRIFIWTLFDFANTSFSILILTTAYSVYFREVVVGNSAIGDFLWGLAFSISMFVVALISPFLGAIADHSSNKKFFLFIFTYLCIVSTGLMFFVERGDVVLGMVLLILANIGFEGGLVFYDAFLPEITSERSYGRVSGYGFAMGYVGSFASLLFVYPFLKGEFTAENMTNVRLSFVIASLFFFVFSLPFFLLIKERKVDLSKDISYFKVGLERVKSTFRNATRYKNIGNFLLSYFIYADGINTVIIFASIFARHTLNFSLVEILTFFLSVQSTAILGSVIFGIIADSIGQKKTLSITLLMWVATAIGAYFCTDKISFYIIGFIAGAAMGSSQSTSRSLMSKIIPPEKKTEFFGFYSFFGKSSAILGPLVFGFVSSITGSQRIAVISVALFFVVGLILLQRVREERFKG